MTTPSKTASVPGSAILHPVVFAAGSLAGAALASPLPASVAGLALLAVVLRLGVMFAATREAPAAAPARG